MCYNEYSKLIDNGKAGVIMDFQALAARAAASLNPGILLNTNGEKFNSMVIGWGHAGILWNLDTFVVYVRQSRYTKTQLDATGAFTISAPLEGRRLSAEVMNACGSQSGRDIDKAGLFTLVPGRKIDVPAIREYPLTLECKVLYRQDQALDAIPEELRARFYSRGSNAGDFHTAYIGQIMDAYIIE